MEEKAAVSSRRDFRLTTTSEFIEETAPSVRRKTGIAALCTVDHALQNSKFAVLSKNYDMPFCFKRGVCEVLSIC